MSRSIGVIALALLLAAQPAAAAARHPAKPAARSAHAPARPVDAATRAAQVAHGGAPRTLDDIHIEGEIPVPQVLFITAREQRRFVEFQHRRYLRTGRQLAGATTLPTTLVVQPNPNTPNQEISR